MIAWEGRPTAFALSHPYLLAFEPQFIEIRHLETAQLVHIITGKNMRMLHSSTSEVSFSPSPLSFLLTTLWSLRIGPWLGYVAVRRIRWG